MKRKLSGVLVIFLLLTSQFQFAFAATAQSITILTNGGRTEYSTGYVMSVAGYVTTSSVAAQGADVFIEILDSSNDPVYYNSTTTDDTGYYMTVFTIPNDFANGSYTIEASTELATATSAFTIKDNAATSSITVTGAYPQGSTSSSPSTVIPVSTTSFLIAFSNNVNYFVNNKISKAIIGENENNQDCLAVYEGTSTKAMSASVKLVNTVSAGTAAASYYNTAGTLSSTTRNSCLLINLGSELKYNTVYKVKIKGNLCANNGSKLGTTTYLYFKTEAASPVTSSGSGSGTTTTATTTTNTQTATTTVTANVDTSGKATAICTADQIKSAIKEAAEKAAAQGDGTKAVVKIKVETASSASKVETTIPAGAMSELSNSNIQQVSIASDIATITFDKNAMGTIAGTSKDIVVSAAKVEPSALTQEEQQIVGDHPVFDFSVTSAGSKISEFGGNVTVAVPYTPAADESYDNIIIYFVKADGTLEIVPNCNYDPATGSISFTTNHFSTYAIGYNKVSFSDVPSTAWYSAAVNFIAARGITSGTSDNIFSPDKSITRGQFIVMLMRAYGIAPDVSPADNFEDAGNTYYTDYIAAAKRLGITSGVGDNLFAPNAQITRQDMFTQMYRALNILGELPAATAGTTLSFYSDSGKVVAYAKDAMMTFVSAGIVSGSNGNLNPTGMSSRAQMAQVLYNLLSE